MLFSAESKKENITKKFSIAPKLTSQNSPSLNILSEYMLYVHIKYNVITLNDKSGGKCGRFYAGSIMRQFKCG